MTKEKSQPCRIAADLLVGLAALASVLLLALRVYDNVSLRNAVPVYTSGCEEEALFSIWKFTQGQAVYTDPHLIPFAASYFNWLFYSVYGLVTKAALAAGALDDRWLPTICRVLTLSFALAGWVICVLTMTELKTGAFFSSARVRWMWSLLLICNPLSGFWLLTARPDVAAVVFELAGFLFLLRYLRTEHSREIVFAVLCLFAAWSFKHSYIAVWISGVMVLTGLRKWQACTWLATGWLVLVVASLGVGGQIYRMDLLWSQIHCAYNLRDIPGLVLSSFGKMPFYPLGLVAVAMMGLPGMTRLIGGSSSTLLLLIAAVVSLGLDTVLAGKEGAADNYFLAASIYSGLLLAKLAGELRPVVLHAGLIAASLVMMAGVGLVVSGKHGVIDQRPYTHSEIALAEKLNGMPGPVFVSDRSGNLPWTQKKPPYFVLAFTYEMDERAGEQHERGGWVGLMREGYFGTVVTSGDNPIGPALLEKYQLVGQDETYRYYVRKAGTPSS